MFSHTVLRLEQQYPILRSEYIQVLLLVVCPLLILLAVIVADLIFARGVRVQNEKAIFRPSLAIRFWWIFVLAAVFISVVFTNRMGAFGVFAHLALAFELVRNFPTNVLIGHHEIRWRTPWAWATLPWESVSCFVKNKSLPGAEEWRLYGREGQRLVISRVTHRDYEKIIHSIAFELRAHQFTSSAAEPRSLLDVIHPAVSIAAAAIIVVGWHFPK
jgi:ABC-type multidrug transport system fused ATPase/permease subunit